MISIFFLAPGLRAEGNKKDGRNNGLDKTTVQKAATYLNINKISTYFFNNGISDISADGNSGLYYPKGSGKTAVFTSGLLWGAKVEGDPDPRMGGTAYRTGLVPGKVLPDGTADDPTLDKYRIYRVRADIYPGGPDIDLSSPALAEGIPASDLRAEYEKDWSEWPADMGAPYFDGNGNGKYDSDPATGDIPGVVGADQTLWYVTNDLNSGQTRFLYGANPLGIEMQATIWAYNRAGALGSMYFRKYKIINVTDRSSLTPTTFQDMYFSMFSDVDDGDAGDDYVGVDTTLSLQFCYNATPTDAVYAPLPPPAVGFDFFQGPLVTGVAGEDKNKNGIDDAEDYGIFNGEKVGPGLINLPMTAAYYFANGDDNIGDPPQGEIQGSREFYNFIRGKFGISGETFTDLATGLPTTYALNGDPVTGTGWLDGEQLPAGDRRQGSASGPFTMAPGDTQEVVVAEIVAGATPGSDNIKAIITLKTYDKVAQGAYDQFFKLPSAPPQPVVNAVALDQMVILDWGSNLAAVQNTENNVNKTFKFQGYNVYQLPTASADKSAGVRIATYDIIDGIKTILSPNVDPVSGVEILLPEQYGDDYGLTRSIKLDKDYVKQIPLANGTRYYYAVTAYSYSPDPFEVPNNLENPLLIMTVVPQAPDPGVTYNDVAGNSLEVTHSTGLADGSVTASVIDPAQTTGHNYEVFFTQQEEVRDANGDWVPAGVEKLRKPNDLTGTSITIAGLYGPNPQSGVELSFSLDLVSSTYSWADGITITFPEGVTILSAPTFEAGGGTIVPEIVGNVVNMGLVNGELTQNGIFHGGETWSIFIAPPALPVAVDWHVYDDGYIDASTPTGVTLDASGTFEITTIGSLSRTAKYWNLRDVTLDEVVLPNQGILSGVDLFPKRDDFQSNIVGSGANPIIDGVQVGVTGLYDAPINWSTISFVKGTGSTTAGLTEGTTPSTTRYVMSNYTAFSGTIDSYAIDNFGFGTTSIDLLQQDYELRWTGVWDSIDVGGRKVYIVKEGTGSLATIFSTATGAAGLATHPLNPNPGTAAPFLIRVPFEVWNKDTHEQVNLAFRDRLQSTTTANPFYAWNIYDRMYAVLVNSPYNSTSPLTGAALDPATWAVVFWSSPGHLGDVITIQYDNPIQIGVDTYTFGDNGSTYSQELAKSQIDKINVFPNPYYGVNPQELNKYNRFVTFSHLPAKATVRIFNLAGVLVKTIEKDDPNQFLRWDLQNNSGLPVASGLYIAYIELPDLGETKILKVAIIQEQQILDRF